MTEPERSLSNVLFDVWLVSRAATALIDEAVGNSGLDADEFAVYSVLASTDGMTPTDLALWMAAPASTVSSYANRFVRRGHVERVPNTSDRRSYRLRLTEAGQAAHLAAGVLFLPVLDRVTQRLGPEVPETHRLLLALHEAITSSEAMATHPPTADRDTRPPPPAG